jgi:Holliday junction resolvase-like predicted endonuclease
MERRINRRQQGDLGEASAIEWLTRQGATVFLPLGHSPDVDLIADFNGRPLRIQVKTTTQRAVTPDGHERFPVSIVTNGGNQSWNKVSKVFDPSRFDFLFVLTGNGRRWFLPAAEIQSERSIQLAGPKYAEFEVCGTEPINALVYEMEDTVLESSPLGEYPRGQRTATVNRQAQPSQVRLLSPPSPGPTKRVGRGPAGTTCIGPTRKVTLPASTVERAALAIGDRLHVSVLREGTLLLTRAHLPDPKP